MGLEIMQVDAFTERPFAGNPAAVCFLTETRDDAWMQNVAMEMNLAETAFLLPQADGYALRWFTPTVEVDLCGHATLASAHALWETGRLPAGAEARFHTRSGLLTAILRDGWIELDFPAERASPVEPPAGLLAAAGAHPVYVGRNRMDYLLALASEAEVRALTPDFRKLAAIESRGIIVTSLSDNPDFDFISRFFAPASGIDEDPVTGSAHCCLGPYWHEKLGRDELTGFQASRRGGVARVRMTGGRVQLIGKAVTTLRGELTTAAGSSLR